MRVSNISIYIKRGAGERDPFLASCGTLLRIDRSLLEPLPIAKYAYSALLEGIS